MVFILLVPKRPSVCDNDRTAPIRYVNGSWIDLNSNDLVNLKQRWHPGQPNGKGIEFCTVFTIKDSLFYDRSCLKGSCFVCAWMNKRENRINYTNDEDL